MKKLKITREQYNALILAEQKRLINNPSNVLTESINENVERLDEGWKEVVLGISMLMGLNLTGQNDLTAKKALSDANIMNQIEATLEDKSKTEELINLMKEKGMKDPSAMLAKNAEEIVDNFNELSDKEKLGAKLNVVTVKSLKALDSKLKQGYALKSVDVSQDTIKSNQPEKIVEIEDTVDFEFGNMKNLFDTGGYNLTNDGRQAIKDAIDSVKSQGGEIISVEIESSTDAQRMPSFISKQDKTGNIKLANLRSNSVNEIVSELVGSAKITTREIPDKIITNMRAEVVKLYGGSKGTIKIGGKKPHFKHKKFKCKRLVDKTGVANCFTF